MEASSLNSAAKVIIRYDGLDDLLSALRKAGYTVIGPVVRDDVIVYEELTAANDLPVGWTDIQEGGAYRLRKRDDGSCFGFNVGPHSWKKFLFPPSLLLWEAKRKENGWEVVSAAGKNAEPKYAFLGVRACELHAIGIQDKVFMKGVYTDPVYRSRREKAFIIAVNCTQAGGTCFCASMHTGPKVTSGFDLSLTEIIQDGDHRFLVETGSERGAEILEKVPVTAAGEEDVELAERIVEETARHMGRTLDTDGLKQLLYDSHESERWDDIAKRCLSCANCTLVCPTCFCSSMEDVTDLKGENAERWRRWNSCFTMGFSYIHGGSVRSSVQSRYRQWITHKLASWIDQFGTSGCVGCGRCITWCPAAIDITREVEALRPPEPQHENITAKNSEP